MTNNYMPEDVIETAIKGSKQNYTGEYEPLKFWAEYGKYYHKLFKYPKEDGTVEDGYDNMDLDVPGIIIRLKEMQPQSILEVGCGFGRNLPYIYDAVMSVTRVVGIDHSPTMIENSKKHIGDYERDTGHKIEMVVGNAKELPFKDNEFDVIFTHACLTHIPPEDIPQVQSEISRVAKKWILHVERFAYLYEHPNLHRWSHLLPPYYLENGWKLHEMDMTRKNPEHYTKILVMKRK